MSPATLDTYSSSVRGLERFLAGAGLPQSGPELRREHIEAFITELLGKWTPATARTRYRALRSFFGWLVEEGEIADSPMARMKPPRLSEAPRRCSPRRSCGALLEVCERDKTSAGRRDEAILRIFMDTGARRGEVLGLTLDDVDLDQGLVRVTAIAGTGREDVLGATAEDPTNSDGGMIDGHD